MATKKEIEALIQKANLWPDSIARSRKEPGAWIMKQTFFYTHGNSAHKMADALKAADPRVEIISACDVWRNWPTTSYFEVRFTVADAVPAAKTTDEQ